MAVQIFFRWFKASLLLVCERNLGALHDKLVNRPRGRPVIGVRIMTRRFCPRNPPGEPVAQNPGSSHS